jgi:hypothetical protein
MARQARRSEPVRLVRAHDPADGSRLWIALSRSRPTAAYVLRPGPDGRWLCSCPRYGFRGDCPHTEALYRLLARPPEAPP